VTPAEPWRNGRVLVIGAAGFMGRHIVRALAAAGAEVHGMVRRASGSNGAGCNVHIGDLMQVETLEGVLRRVMPTHVFNVAGRLKPDPLDPDALWRVHVEGTSNLFAALNAAGVRPTVFIASSAAVYGVPAELPTTEQAPRRARSPYGASKLAQEDVALAAMRELGMPVVCTRSFNLLGPGLSPELVASQVARDVARAERGGPAVLQVGNLSHRRDFLDIRDAVAAFLALSAVPSAVPVYNVCSGRSVPVRACVERLVSSAKVQVQVAVDPARLGMTDVEDIFGSVTRLAEVARWRDLIPLERSLDDLLDDWRARAAEEKG
jgi:GDP-4-dehydro-6-deoxy-D-mannose reductase